MLTGSRLRLGSWRRLRLGILVTVAGALAVSCGPKANGTVEGRGVLYGGPSPGQYPLSGTLQVHADSGTGPEVAKVKLDADGRFRVSLPAGSYVFKAGPAANGPPCQSHEVAVTSAKTTSGVSIACSIP